MPTPADLACDVDRCFLGITPVRVGAETRAFVAMLDVMYQGFAARRGWDVAVWNREIADGGVNSLWLEIVGTGVCADLAGEHGLQRLARVPPTPEANGRRQSSLAAVEVLPKLVDPAAVVIADADLRISIIHDGQCGMHAPGVDRSPVLVTHKPTRAAVRCGFGSVEENRQAALQVVRARIAAALQHGQEPVPAQSKAFRTYTLFPYQRVVDVRAGVESGDAAAVLAGDLDAFVKASNP